MGSSSRTGLQEAFDRLELRYAVQELAGLKKPPKLRQAGLVARAGASLARARAAWAAGGEALSGWRLTWIYLRLVAELRRLTGTLWDAPLEAWRVAADRARGHLTRLREVAPYAASSPREDQALRIGILLRVMGHRAAAVRVLAARVASTLPAAWSGYFLRQWLVEVGEAKAAATMPDTPPSAVESAPRRTATRLRYGVVVMTMFDTPVFRASVRSLQQSDFNGTIVVVEDGVETAEACRAFCESAGVTYVKNPSWSGCAAQLNLGIRHLPAETDVVLSSHNDVLWPSRWLADLDRAWERVWASDKVSLLNLSYLQCSGWVDASLKELFTCGRYDDLVWVLRSMREVPRLMDRVQEVQARPGESPFGLGRDPWIDWMAELRQMTGRYSVAASFPMHVWRELGGFDPDLFYAFDLQLLHHNLTKRRWALFIENQPLLHLKSLDTEAISAEKTAEVGTRFLTSTYDGFHRNYGWHIEHFLNLYFSESTVVHRDAILKAVNSGRFGDVDYVFDDFARRLQTRTLDNCELTWCRSRAQCPYLGAVPA